MERRRIVKGMVDDLVLLDNLSEKGVVQNLQARYDEDLIYTYIGPVLVYVLAFGLGFAHELPIEQPR